MSTNTIAKFLSMNGVGNGAVVISFTPLQEFETITHRNIKVCLTISRIILDAYGDGVVYKQKYGRFTSPVSLHY